MDKQNIDLTAPLTLYKRRVHEKFIDYNGHMTESRYLHVFGEAVDVFYALIGADENYRAGGHSFYTAETHLRHLREVKVGSEIKLTIQLLGFDEKRMHIVHEMYRQVEGKEDVLLATAEQMLLHVNMQQSATCVMLPAITDKLKQLWEGQKRIAAPDYVGKSIRQLATRVV